MNATKRADVPGRNTFAFYWSFKDAIRDMADADKLTIYEAITDFAFFGIEPDALTPIGRLAWKLIRPQLEASMRRFDACTANGKKGAEYGALGGRPRKNNPKEKPQCVTPEHNPLNHNVNVNVNDKDKGDYKGDADKPRSVASKRTAFVAPSLETLKAYFPTIGGTAQDAESFFDHFEANGWKVSGKFPMKSWQAAARNWMRRKPEFITNKQNTSNYETKRYKDL